MAASESSFDAEYSLLLELACSVPQKSFIVKGVKEESCPDPSREEVIPIDYYYLLSGRYSGDVSGVMPPPMRYHRRRNKSVLQSPCIDSEQETPQPEPGILAEYSLSSSENDEEVVKAEWEPIPSSMQNEDELEEGEVSPMTLPEPAHDARSYLKRKRDASPGCFLCVEEEVEDGELV